MSKAFKVLLAILAVVVIVGLAIFFYITGVYNNMVAMDEGAKTAWSQVENQYQRRSDLIPNLVSTVKGYSIHEAETLEAVVKARAEATQTNVNVSDTNSFSEFQNSQDSLTAALGKLMVVVEQYPDLKADKTFLELQAQLEGTENRISVARKNFNETVRDYNIYIRQFPNNFIAGMFRFEKANLFENQPGAEIAPVVDFS